MRLVCVFPSASALSWRGVYREGYGAIMAATLDVALNPSNRWAMRAVGFVVDDLAYAAHPTYHGGYRVVLYRASGSFCRRDSRTADCRANGATLLIFLRCRSEVSDRFSVW